MQGTVIFQLKKKGDTLVRDYPLWSFGTPGAGGRIDIEPNSQITVIVGISELIPGQEVHIGIFSTEQELLHNIFNATTDKYLRSVTIPNQSHADVGYVVRIRGRIPLAGGLLAEGTDQILDYALIVYDSSKPLYTQAELDQINQETLKAREEGKIGADVPAQIAGAVLKALGLLEPFAPVLIAAGLVVVAFTFAPQLIGGLGAGIAGAIRGAFRSDS